MYPHSERAAFETWPPMTVDEPTWDDVVEWQAGRCAMCGKTGQRLVEDHNHRTGLSRGILCWSCNVCEGSVSHSAWDRWRAGSTPARLWGVERIYPGRTYTDDEWTDEDEARAFEAVRSIPAPNV